LSNEVNDVLDVGLDVGEYAGSSLCISGYVIQVGQQLLRLRNGCLPLDLIHHAAIHLFGERHVFRRDFADRQTIGLGYLRRYAH
jgi:hypothetical protein